MCQNPFLKCVFALEKIFVDFRGGPPFDKKMRESVLSAFLNPNALNATQICGELGNTYTAEHPRWADPWPASPLATPFLTKISKNRKSENGLLAHGSGQLVCFP